MISKRQGGVKWSSPNQSTNDLFIDYNCVVDLFLFLYKAFELFWNKEGRTMRKCALSMSRDSPWLCAFLSLEAHCKQLSRWFVSCGNLMCHAASDSNYRNLTGEYKISQINGILDFKKYTADTLFLGASQLSWPLYIKLFLVSISKEEYEEREKNVQFQCFQSDALGRQAEVNLRDFSLPWESQNSREWEKPVRICQQIYDYKQQVSQSLRKY